MNFRLATRHDWERIRAYLRTLPWHRDGRRLTYRVTIEEAKPTRSLEQNAFYWALLTEISQQAPPHMGGEWWAPEIWAEFFKRRFLGVEAGPGGIEVAKSTRRLKVGEMSDYLHEIQAWAYDELPGFRFEYEEAA